jgi:predicted nucleic acid-binding protein
LIVVDASVAVQWIAEEDTSSLSETLLTRSDLVAPDLLLIEVANALRRKVYVGDISIDHAKAGLQFIREKVRLERTSAEILDRALELAELMYDPVYDCIYLAMAERSKTILVTYDQELQERASEQGLASLLAGLPLSS